MARPRTPSERDLVATVLEAARDGDWRAAAWVLERRFPLRWRRDSVFGEQEPPAPSRDALDELAGKRTARRGGK